MQIQLGKGCFVVGSNAALQCVKPGSYMGVLRRQSIFGCVSDTLSYKKTTGCCKDLSTGSTGLGPGINPGAR